MNERRDRRTVQTRRALLDAFNQLFLHRRQRNIRVPDIVAGAGIGRSTFYEHFGNAEAIRLEALSVPFTALADAAVGKGEAQALEALLVHFWENRQRAREHFYGRMGDQALGLLTQMVETRLGDGLALSLPARLAAHQLAAAILAPIRAWVRGEASCSAEALSDNLCRVGRELIAALRRD